MWLKCCKALVTRHVRPPQQTLLHLDYSFQFLGNRHYTPAACCYITKRYGIRLLLELGLLQVPLSGLQTLILVLSTRQGDPFGQEITFKEAEK